MATFGRGTATSENLHRRSIFKGTGRFILKRQLGSGGFGTVYQVWDREEEKLMALKELSIIDPEGLFRFKLEFRSLVELRHPNLIRLFELFREDDAWFFTMEFIDGRNVVEHLRPDGVPLKIHEVRSVVRQIVEGLAFLHQNGKVHRDIKPGNILVSSPGRPVILDFGLIRDEETLGTDRSVSLVGTPAYMAPEQLRQAALTCAADWYSLGVVLYQILTGEMPGVMDIAGNTIDLVDAPSLKNPEVPEDLDTLCRELLSCTPDLRPTIDRIRKLLGGAEHSSELKPPKPLDDGLFVGRAQELAALLSAFKSTRSRGLNILVVEGKSGIGKTTLIKKAFDSISAAEPGALLLRGRCREFESVPYKGIDSVIDHLAQILLNWNPSSVAGLLPRDAFLLPRLFPTLGRVKAIASSPVTITGIADAQELRQRTFVALREMLARLAERVPLILWIDDFQWSDRDSNLFLAELCAPPSEPPLLLLLTLRNDVSAEDNAPNRFLSNLLPKGNTIERTLHLEGLSADETLELLHRISLHDLSSSIKHQIVTDAGGHPLFIRELAKLVNPKHVNQIDRLDALRVMLQARIAALPLIQSEILQLVCLAAQPLNLKWVMSLVASDSDWEAAIDALQDQHLIKSIGFGDKKSIEPYHDQIRNAVVAIMSPDLRRARHAQLAKLLMKHNASEPQRLLTHLLESGDRAGAQKAAIRAAMLSEDKLAFDRAAQFYETALTVTDGEEKGYLYRRLADALAKAGRGHDSATAYRRAADFATENALEMNRQAIDQLMRSGYIDEALRLFHKFARTIRLKSIRSPFRAVLGLLAGRIRIRLRLLTGIPVPSQSAISANNILRLETLRTGAIVLDGVDPVIASCYQVAYIEEAIKVREPSHLAQALSFEASLRVATRPRDVIAVLALLRDAEAIALGTRNANTIGTVRLCRAYIDYLLGSIDEGIRDTEAAIAYLKSHCSGVAWELTAAYVLLFWFKCWGGRVRDVRSLLPQLLKEGSARGDVNLEVSLRLLSYVHYAHLSADEPTLCLAECEDAIRRWSKAGFHLQHYGALFIKVETNLYQGAYDRARTLLMSEWPALSKSFILRWQILRLMALFLRGRVSLACWLENPKNDMLRRDVEYCIRRLKRQRSTWSQPMVAVLLAGLAIGSHDLTRGATLLQTAELGFRSISLKAFASAVEHIRLQVVGDPATSAEQSSTMDFLRAEGVKNPDAFIRMLIPGSWVSGAAFSARRSY